jgi:small GTP-binding protein
MSSLNLKKILYPWKIFQSNKSLTNDNEITSTNDISDINNDNNTNGCYERIITKPTEHYNILTEINKYNKCKSGFKIIILGDTGVGKTSIYNSLLDKTDPGNTTSTYRADSSLIHYDDIILILNDTVGQETFRSICQNYYREPQIVIFVFDITRMETFMNIPEWQQEVIKRNDKNIPIKYYLLAHKRDLNPTRTLEGATTFAKNNDMTFIVTSVNQQETINIFKTDMFTYVKNNKDKGKANLFYDVLRINNVPLISSCCNI